MVNQTAPWIGIHDSTYFGKLVQNLRRLGPADSHRSEVRFAVHGKGLPSYCLVTPGGYTVYYGGKNEMLTTEEGQSIEYWPEPLHSKQIRELFSAARGGRIMSNESNKPWEQVTDHLYFRRVMGNMVRLGFGPKANGAGGVRFGLTGIGHSPNYQIEGRDGSKHCFNGMGHGEASHVDEEFTADRLSGELFDYKAVEQMLARCLAQRGDTTS